jgi:hypothetical protein
MSKHRIILCCSIGLQRLDFEIFRKGGPLSINAVWDDFNSQFLILNSKNGFIFYAFAQYVFQKRDPSVLDEFFS